MTDERHELALWFRHKVDAEHCYRAFEAYGHAMAAASTFELLMALLTMRAMALRLDKRANARIQPADHDRLLLSLRKGTFEKLQRRLTDCYTLSEPLRSELKDAKNTRDYLAHEFWQVHCADLCSADGVEVIATAAALYADHFRKLANAVMAETGQDAHDYIDMLTAQPGYGQKLAGWHGLFAAELAE